MGEVVKGFYTIGSSVGKALTGKESGAIQLAKWTNQNRLGVTPKDEGKMLRTSPKDYLQWARAYIFQSFLEQDEKTYNYLVGIHGSSSNLGKKYIQLYGKDNLYKNWLGDVDGIPFPGPWSVQEGDGGVGIQDPLYRQASLGGGWRRLPINKKSDSVYRFIPKPTTYIKLGGSLAIASAVTKAASTGLKTLGKFGGPTPQAITAMGKNSSLSRIYGI
jgi:hypothetical protein